MLGWWCRIVKKAVKGGNVSDAVGARVRTALDRLEAAEKDLSLAAKRVTEARELLRTAFRDERSCSCSSVDESGVPYLNQKECSC